MLVGQGSPILSPTQVPRGLCARRVARGGARPMPLCWAVFWLALLTLGGVSGAAEPASVRIRVEWGGGTERRWEGSIGVSRGELAEPCSLGVEADEPGSMWLDGGALAVRQRSARTYDGVDLRVTADLDEHLLIELAPAGQGRANALRFRLADLLGEFRSEAIDDQGNRVLVRRAPGDRLRVTVKDRSLVFLPGDVFRLEVTPDLLPVPTDTKLRLSVQLLEGRGGNMLWQTDHTAKAGEGVPIAVNVPLPNQEGVYDVSIAALHAGWQQAVRMPLGAKPIAERRIQVLVLNPRATTVAPAGADPNAIDEIDPTSSRRWEERLARLPQLPVLPKMRKGPLGNGSLQVRQHALGSLAQLQPSRTSSDGSWQAYTLAISRPGQPHVLEVDYPSDVPQTLAISVLEPNAAGALSSGVDSGVDVPEPIAKETSPPRWLRHRLVFWPRTKGPMVLLSNRSTRRSAAYGKIRVLAGWEHLPRAFPAASAQPARVLAAYLDRPLFPENFSASETLDAWIGRSLDDWFTFYEGGTRLVEYLNYAGFDSLMLSVLADGSTIYPSKLLEPTPRYDTGVFFDSGQDLLRKDVLEMLLRLFDRERLRLIPTLDFASPLPRLEELLRRGGPEAQSLRWIGPAGTVLSDTRPARRALAPYYNLLDPRVQEEMLAVVRELARAYGQHPSFAALALRLSPDGYAQIPGPEWGLDDATIARFQRDCKLRVPGEGPQRFAVRAKSLAAEGVQRVWLQWRADEAARFYRRVHAELVAVRPGCRLYLAGSDILASPELQGQLRPTLPRRTTLADCLLWAGIDPRHYQSDDGVVLLRPEQVSSLNRLASQAVNLEIQQMPDADRLFQDLSVRGNLFFHPPERAAIPALEEKGSFRAANGELMSQLLPSGRENRRRFLHAMATSDSAVMVDGGWLQPLGQEDGLRSFVDVYRRLPAVRMERAGDSAADATQAVTVRFGAHEGRTWVYLVNDAPFPATVRVPIEGPADLRIEEVTGSRKLPAPEVGPQGTTWNVPLEPYDLVAVTFSAVGVRLGRPSAASPAAVAAGLAERVRDLGVRAAMLGNPAPLDVLSNPGFETVATDRAPLPGWTLTTPAGTKALAETTDKHAGARSLHLTSSGESMRVLGEPFDAPATGRISVSVWMRVLDAARQPPLQLAVEGKLDGAQYYRFAMVGQAPPGATPVPQIAAQWANYIFQVDDLPLEGLSHLRVRFDLAGAGDVWIDDVQVFHLAFNRKERIELSKLIALADIRLQNGQLGDCLHLLEGYWPRYLETHVALPTTPSGDPSTAATRTGRQQARTPEASQDRSGLMDRFKGMLPRQLRF
jgi:hypothetical protein